MPLGQSDRVRRNIIGKRVREARLRLDPPLTQDRLSGKLAKRGIQLDRVAVAKVETGLRCAFDFEVAALAQVLKVDASWLLGLEGFTGKVSKHPQRERRRS
jgi:hypothetical protein